MGELVSYIMNNISNVLAAVSIVLGLLALIQSFRYNMDSEKMVKDMKFMMVQQIKLSNELKKIMINQGRNPDILYLSKDGIQLHKLSKFNKRDIANIMDRINHLIIKKRFLDKIYNFLKSDDSDYYCNFWGGAASDEEVDIEKLYEILLEYNIIMIIDYH